MAAFILRSLRSLQMSRTVSIASGLSRTMEKNRDGFLKLPLVSTFWLLEQI